MLIIRNRKMKIKNWLTEVIRRLAQYFVGIFIFDFPGFLAIRKLVYSFICKIQGKVVISSKVLFYVPHGLEKCKINIGNNVRISNNVRVDCSAPIVIEDHVWISENVMILGHEHNIRGREIKDTKDIIVTQGLVIEEDAWIGAGAIILPRVSRIARGGVIGAGSVVTKDVDEYEIVAGNPAKKIGSRE